MCGVGITIYIIILFMIKIFKTMKDYLEKIEQKCRENNITFIGFANENNEYKNNIKNPMILGYYCHLYADYSFNNFHNTSLLSLYRHIIVFHSGSI